jgi:hypothetical protein
MQDLSTCFAGNCSSWSQQSPAAADVPLFAAARCNWALLYSLPPTSAQLQSTALAHQLLLLRPSGQAEAGWSSAATASKQQGKQGGGLRRKLIQLDRYCWSGCIAVHNTCWHRTASPKLCEENFQPASAPASLCAQLHMLLVFSLLQPRLNPIKCATQDAACRQSCIVQMLCIRSAQPVTLMQ